MHTMMVAGHNHNARDAITEFNTLDALTTLFDNLYVLRNQILRGGATYGSSVNRQQLQDDTKILASLLPNFFDIMQANIHIEGWSKPYYPRVYIQSS